MTLEMKSFKIAFAIIIVISTALLFPLINLMIDRPVAVAPDALLGKTPLFQKAAPVIQVSCLNCHSYRTQLPWYASLPLAQKLIQRDIEDAREAVDFEKELFTPNQAPAKKTLVKMKAEIRDGAMPPIEYKALHWKAVLSSKEKQAILDWIAEQQSLRS